MPGSCLGLARVGGGRDDQINLSELDTGRTLALLIPGPEGYL